MRRPGSPLRGAALLVGLVSVACGVDLSAPRAYRCSSDEECRAGWRCLGDSYCHAPDLGVATPCGADADCAGGWRCLGDRVCHDPGVGVGTACGADGDCAGGWECLGDGLCHDPAVGVTVRCVTAGDCAAGWMCLGDKLCHDPALGVSTPCVSSGDCAGGWKCLGDNVCHDPDVGVTTRCVADGDCAGGWLCLGDNVCHDPGIGVSTACVVDGDCAASWRCLGDKLCHDPDAGASTPCVASADCAGGWRCADRLCRDPAVGITLPCTTSADCLGGWFCGRDRVCRDPQVPGPFSCAADSECAGGWRCASEGLCVDAAAELAAVPPAGPVAVELVSPRVPAPAELRVATPALVPTDGGLVVRHLAAGLVPGGLLVGAVVSTTSLGVSSVQHLAQWSMVPLDPDAGVPLDFVVAQDQVAVLWPDGGVERSRPGGSFAPFSTGTALAQRLSTVFVGAGAQGEPAPVVFTDGPAFVLLPDGGTSTWSGGKQILDVVAGDGVDGGLLVAWSDGTTDIVETLPLGGPLGSGTEVWAASSTDYGDLRLTWLRTRGEVVAGAYKFPTAARGTGSVKMPLGGIGDGGVGVADPANSQEMVRFLEQTVNIALPGWWDVTCACPRDETLEDFEVVQVGAEVGVEIACRNPAYEGLLVYEGTLSTGTRLVFERRVLRHAGGSRTHASATATGAVRFSSALSSYDLSTLLASAPAVVASLDGRPFAVAGASVYFAAAEGLVLQASEGDFRALPAGTVEGSAIVVLGSSAGVDLAVKPPRVVFALEGTPVISRATGRQFGRSTIVSGDDTLYAAALGDAGVTVLRSVLRPAPGFRVEDWVAQPLDGGYAGWLVTNNQLYALQANTLDRWRSTSWPISGRDVLGVWWAGAGARAGTASGEVFSLPSRVPVAPAVPGGVTSIAGRCGDVFAVADDVILRLGPDAGWAALDASVPLRAPRVMETDLGLFVVDDDGRVLALRLPAGADGGCP